MRPASFIFFLFRFDRHIIISFQLILELCRTQSDAKVIEPHLKRIRSPAAPSHSSAPTVVNKIQYSELHNKLNLNTPATILTILGLSSL